MNVATLAEVEQQRLQAQERLDAQKNAANTVVDILAAEPAIGPVKVIYVGPNADVPDMRYLIVLFRGERAFLFDRLEGRTTIVDLDAKLEIPVRVNTLWIDREFCHERAPLLLSLDR